MTTVREREYWVKFFTQALHARAADLKAKNSAQIARLKVQADERAQRKLGVLGMKRRIAELDSLIENSKKRLRKLEDDVAVKILDLGDENVHYSSRNIADTVLHKVKDVEYKKLLSKSDFGKVIITLENQISSVEATIMLATTKGMMAKAVEDLASALDIEVGAIGE